MIHPPTHTHTKGIIPSSTWLIYVSVLHCPKPHAGTEYISMMQGPLKRYRLLFWGVARFYGNSLSKTLNFIHIYFADPENKLMFNLGKLWVLKKRKLAHQQMSGAGTHFVWKCLGGVRGEWVFSCLRCNQRPAFNLYNVLVWIFHPY